VVGGRAGGLAQSTTVGRGDMPEEIEVVGEGPS
jgi:hypothetical protein